MGETFVAIAAEILAAHGITPLVIADAAPTPAISYEITRSKADGAINFTASHNPPQYNGIKFNSSDGAPALPEMTQSIEAEIEKADQEHSHHGEHKGHGEDQRHVREEQNQNQPKIENIDVKPRYLARLKEIIDLKTIAASGLKVVFDPFWGAGRGYVDELLRGAGVAVATVHDVRDVLFGGHAPEPEDHLLDQARAKM